jgi:DNA-binding transcriptional ArsR family regulator
MALHNLWHLHNLRESPYFQQDLQVSGEARYPIELFVGRESEAERLLNVIGGAPSSRQTVEGLPGFGKTTLVQYVKAQAVKAGYISYPDPVSAAGADSADSLLVRILSHVHDAITSHLGEKVLGETAVDTARRLVLDTRVRDVKVSASIGGFGGSREVTKRTEPAAFHSGLLTMPPLLRDLSSIVRRHGFAGIIVHLNNLENLAGDAERTRAGLVIRDLRDIFLFEGYHFLLVGPPEPVRAIISPHAQLRSVFGIGRPLEPLSSDDFQRLLARRYTHLRLSAEEEVRPPVAHDAAGELYRLFRGDLRGTLRALDAASHELVGYTDPPGSPIGGAQLLQVLVPMLQTEAEAALSETLLNYLHLLRELGGALFTQKDLVALWDVAQPTVSTHLKELQRLGYVEEYGREGRAMSYGLTGSARLVLELHGTPEN